MLLDGPSGNTLQMSGPLYSQGGCNNVFIHRLRNIPIYHAKKRLIIDTEDRIDCVMEEFYESKI